MGKDYRIGLVAGLVLALATLVWVATRPSLNPQVRMAPVSPLSQTDTTQPLPWEKAGPQTSPGPSQHADRNAAPASGSDTPKPPEPQDRTPNPATASGTKPPGPMPTRVEPIPAPVPDANPTALPDLTIYQKAEKIKTTKFHIVQRGETLSGIARQYYGAPDQWRKILTANEKVIKDPNRLAPGTKLIIPE